MPEERVKTYIITGASMGVGRAVVLALARKGVGLVLNARSVRPLEETTAAGRKFGVPVEAVSGNAASDEVGRELVEKACRLGDFTGVIHAAGVLHPGPFLWELSTRQAQEVIEANYMAAVTLIRNAVPVLRAQGHGVFVLFGSGAAELNNPGIGLYCTAKTAEERLGFQLAVEAPEISTIVYRPGMVETRMQAQARSAEGGAARFIKTTFQTYKDDGLLLNPERSAEGLLKVLKTPHRYHGKIVDVRRLEF